MLQVYILYLKEHGHGSACTRKVSHIRRKIVAILVQWLNKQIHCLLSNNNNDIHHVSMIS